MTKNVNKILLLISIFTVATCAVLFASTFATAEGQSVTDDPSTYTVSGKVVDTNNVALQNVLASGSFFDENGKAYITDDVLTNERGEFTIAGVLKGSYGAISFFPAKKDNSHSGVKSYIDGPITSNFNIEDAKLPSLTNQVSGKVTDVNGAGIPNVTLEFYNVASVKSPFVDIAAKTDAEGNYSLDKPISSPDYYSGVSIGSDYYVVAQTGECEKGYLSQMLDLPKVSESGNELNFQLNRTVNLKLYDNDQTENGWAEWYHEFYINGVLQSEGSYLGDSFFQVPLNAKLKFKENCQLELSYIIEGNQYVDTFVPAFRNAVAWEAQGFDENLVGDYWNFWINNKPEDASPIECRDGYSYQCDDTTNHLYLDVTFKEKPIEPGEVEVEVATPAQTGDSNWIIFAIIGAILLFAIAGLVTYYVMKKKKDSKKNNYKPKH